MRRIEALCIGVGLLCAVIALITARALPTPEDPVAFVAYLGGPVLAAAVALRIAYPRIADTTTAAYVPWFVIAMPTVTTLLAVPLVLAAEPGDRFSNILVWLLIVHLFSVVGLIGVLGVMATMELLGRGLLRVVRGGTGGGRLLFWGMLVALALAFISVGAFAVRDLPPGRVGLVPLAFALLGIPGGYTVVSEPLLWVLRVIVLLTIAVGLAAAQFEPVTRQHARERRERGQRRIAARANSRQYLRERRRSRPRRRR